MFPTFQKFDLIAGKYWDREPRFAIVSVPERETFRSEKFSSRLDLQARSLQTSWNRGMRRMRRCASWSALRPTEGLTRSLATTSASAQSKLN